MWAEFPPDNLAGSYVRLEPLRQTHAQALFDYGRQQQDWQYMPRACFESLADTQQWIDEAQQSSDQLAFAIVDIAHNHAVGSTRYLNIRPQHRGVEIGWTWLAATAQRSPVNTETKLLLLSYAFEQLNCVRVEFKTDANNLRSQRAIERLGAQREGVLRNHMIVQQGRYRDSVYFSIIESEWPQVHQRLEQMLRR